MASKQPVEGFEALYNRLEETVAKLEQGNLALEESLTLYEDGMKLAKRCQEMLQEAELRVSRLQEQFGDSPAVIRDDDAAYGGDSDEQPLYDE